MNTTEKKELGYMEMPPNFRYSAVFKKGKPQHDISDDFYIKHPPMPVSKWAKIFSPFDALSGFSEAIREKEELSEDD
ncbi:MAG: hypothetical protein IKP88_12480 [Lachnospiraceae bacterium]|nr:hypothetical protein [Lachnospiraceae bacterium]